MNLVDWACQPEQGFLSRLLEEQTSSAASAKKMGVQA